MIPLHIAPKFSAMDCAIARAVPPGGNWKDIPESVPSQRLKQIRESYARGGGSRSTYYGRLHPNRPAYTISTYFTRPGNGCHLHYESLQNRTISYREAARLQSFPDSFQFVGPLTSVSAQIGNAVPPLLALFIARAFGRPGEVVDLFAGAGGLSLGFHWAGWTGLVASDIDANAMASFTRNVHTNTIVGDIRSKSLRKEIAERLHGNRSKKKPLILLGGPPCQGFSTAGNRRSLDDERNHLFRDYIALVDALAPDAFVFENVPGILNMEGGAVFKEILAALRRVSTDTRVWQLSAEEFGVPQRRRRVVVVGFRKMKPVCNPTGPLQDGLFGGTPVSVKAALEDLPPLNAGEDGSTKEYLSAPLTPFQALMRGRMDPGRYVDSLKPQHPFESNRPQLSSKSNGART